MDLEALEVRDALLQTLQSAQRCGLSRIPRMSADDFDPQLLDKIETLANGDSADPAAAQPPIAAPVAKTVAPTAEPKSQPPAAQPGKWSLPVVSIADRQPRFDALAKEASACRDCTKIVDFRQQTVFGDGNLSPKVCFIGEAPGADEDRQGKPFVGRAGQLLTKIIGAMKLTREEVYILNALKCRPPQNRTPLPDEIDACRRFVESQLEILQPQYIVCLGAVAVRSVLQKSDSIGRLRGRFHTYRGANVVVTYHPSYLLRNENAKRFVWDDMQMLMREMGLME